MKARSFQYVQKKILFVFSARKTKKLFQFNCFSHQTFTVKVEQCRRKSHQTAPQREWTRCTLVYIGCRCKWDMGGGVHVLLRLIDLSLLLVFCDCAVGREIYYCYLCLHTHTHTWMWVYACLGVHPIDGCSWCIKSNPDIKGRIKTWLAQKERARACLTISATAH